MVTKVAVVASVVVAGLVGAAIFGYAFLLPASHPASSTRNQQSASNPAFTSSSAGTLEITSASLSGTSLSVTVENLESQSVSIDSLLLARGSGCSLATTTSVSETGQNGTRLFASSCLQGGLAFLIQTNSTLRPIAAAAFNFTAFNSTSFTRSFTGNFSRTLTGNFTRTFSGNFTGSFPGNFTGSFPGNFTGARGFNGTGFQIAAGQTVTLTYNGSSVSNLAAGQYTVMVEGQAEAEITIVVG